MQDHPLQQQRAAAAAAGAAGSNTINGNTLWGGLASGCQTPAILSPAALAAVAMRGMTTVDCMEALLSDKDFALPSAFNTPGAHTIHAARARICNLTCLHRCHVGA
jgi:hypothetical protein